MHPKKTHSRARGAPSRSPNCEPGDRPHGGFPRNVLRGDGLRQRPSIGPARSRPRLAGADLFPRPPGSCACSSFQIRNTVGGLSGNLEDPLAERPRPQLLGQSTRIAWVALLTPALRDARTPISATWGQSVSQSQALCRPSSNQSASRRGFCARRRPRPGRSSRRGSPGAAGRSAKSPRACSSLHAHRARCTVRSLPPFVGDC
jgi:hypothetical protein